MVRRRFLPWALVLGVAALRIAAADDAPPVVAPPRAAPPTTAAPPTPARDPHDLGVFPLAATGVVDGDTLKLDTPRESVRVHGVDAEEVFHDPDARRAATADFAAYAKAQRGTSSTPKKFGTPAGEAAKAFAEAFFRGVTHVRLEADQVGLERDGYGRRLAHVFATKDGQEVLFAEALIRAGWSPYFVKYGRSARHDAALASAQEDARAARRGIWGDDVAHYLDYAERLAWWEARAKQVDAWDAEVHAPPEKPGHVRLGVPPETERLASMLGQRVTLFGSLDRVEADRAPSRLLLVDAPHRPFAVVVLDPKVFAALDLDAVAARFVRVSGTLSEFRGRLQVVLEHAEDLSTR